LFVLLLLLAAAAAALAPFVRRASPRTHDRRTHVRSRGDDIQPLTHYDLVDVVVVRSTAAALSSRCVVVVV